MAKKIGNVVYSDPRAVEVNGRHIEGVDDEEPHSTVHGSISIMVKSKSQADLIMKNWDHVVQEIDIAIGRITAGESNAEAD